MESRARMGFFDGAAKAVLRQSGPDPAFLRQLADPTIGSLGGGAVQQAAVAVESQHRGQIASAGGMQKQWRSVEES